MNNLKWNILNPRFVDADIICGETLVFTKVTPEDAEFIVKLRTDQKKGKFLSATSGDVEKQKEYIEKCIKSNDQMYYIIRDINGEAFGTVRFYDIIDNSFCWGSWIIKDDAPKNCAIESVLMVYSYGFLCGFRNAHIDVMKGNKTVMSFHERLFGAKIIRETEAMNYYSLQFDDIINAMNRYKKFLPNGINVVLTNND